MNKDIKGHYLLGAVGACVLLAVGAAYLLAPSVLRTGIEEDTVVLGTENSKDAAQNGSESPIVPGAQTQPPKDRLCAEVITQAKDPKMQTVHEFPTPCDVPVGWIIINASQPQNNKEDNRPICPKLGPITADCRPAYR